MDDAREEVVREMRRLGLNSGWACINTEGLGLPWCRALVLLLLHKKRSQPSVRALARYFVSRKHTIDWRETGLRPRDLQDCSDGRWAKLLRGYKQRLQQH